MDNVWLSGTKLHFRVNDRSNLQTGFDIPNVTQLISIHFSSVKQQMKKSQK